MPSSLNWLDHDATARDRSMRILALFQEKESRDELGFGGIRDSFADMLFPGTSTIQTRLRYMLFIPWIYKQLENQRIPVGKFAQTADRIERDLVQPLLDSDDKSGVFGRTAGRRLKRLPSSVYWAGLRSWDIRRVDLSQDQYHRQIGVIYLRRKEQINRERKRSKRGDDGEATPEAGVLTWHPRLPEPPDDFPAKLNFQLTKEEAGFLLDRIKRSHPDSLLAHLALNCEPEEIDAPWLHPDRATFSKENKELLEHGRLFSEVMHGAALLYNISLAELKHLDEKTDEYRLNFHEWINSLDSNEVANWSLDDLWALTDNVGHTITYSTKRFVEQWVGMVVQKQAGLIDDTFARKLIRQREISLKKAHSRFKNQRALDQWGGSSGLGRMTYRWPTASAFLNDLYSGLGQVGE